MIFAVSLALKSPKLNDLCINHVQLERIYKYTHTLNQPDLRCRLFGPGGVECAGVALHSGYAPAGFHNGKDSRIF